MFLMDNPSPRAVPLDLQFITIRITVNKLCWDVLLTFDRCCLGMLH